MTDFNISGISAGIPASGIGKVNDEEQVKKSSCKEEAKKLVKETTDENEQVELQCIDDKDNNIEKFWNKLISKKGQSGWEEISKRKQKIQNQQADLEKQMIDVTRAKRLLEYGQAKTIEEALDMVETQNKIQSELNKPVALE